ncbi:MAG: hypothetical protein GEU90_05640 [Gemmatimonas sp.]|nr:hypothetical protein [Gemmatimonas sp.]
MIDRTNFLLVPLVLFGLASCGRDPEEGAIASDWDGTGVGWTTDLISRIPEVSREAQLIGLAPIQEVRTGVDDGFDRMVIEIEGRGMPNYEVEYAAEPLQYCETGEPVQLEGTATLHVRLEPAKARNEQGRVLFSNSGGRTGLPVLVEQQLVCDRDGSVEWAVGVASPNAYRVLQLTEMNRIVLDIRHEG